MKAIRVHETGGPENLVLDDIDIPDAGPGELLIRVAAAGLNYIDTYHRSGLYQLDFPVTLGLEGGGIVEKTGDGVSGFSVGDPVGWGTCQGSYADYIAAPAEKVVKLPDGITTSQAAALMLQGMTVHYLTHSTYPLKSGDTALVHAAAGGVGLLMVQVAKKLGARVIGTAGTEEKAVLAKEAGADEVIVYTSEDFQTETRRLTDRAGVDVAYDSVGAATWEGSLNSLKPRGYLVLFGNASGPVPPVDPLLLTQKGSLFMTRPSLMGYTLTREELVQRAEDVLGWVADGSLKLRIDREVPLADAADAHRALESRETKGKVLIVP